ncbi:putative holin-like toxin [Bacillus safensis]|uniref:putative holin-like toxin n=1 Tax=Bacillus safensis TaxID=561879 RepID=UPI002FCD30BA
MCFPIFSCIIDIVQLNGLQGRSGSSPYRKGVMLMSTYEAISLMIAFGIYTLSILTLVVALLTIFKKKK